MKLSRLVKHIKLLQHKSLDSYLPQRILFQAEFFVNRIQ